jgi:hypothetical protein
MSATWTLNRTPIENKYNALREEVLPKAEMETRHRLNEQEPLKPVRS